MNCRHHRSTGQGFCRGFIFFAGLFLAITGVAAHAQSLFTAPAPLSTTTATDIQVYPPQLTTDGLGHWVVVWCSTDNLGGTIGNDYDILVSRSMNNGVTWTAPAPLNTNAASDPGNSSGGDYSPEVATDGLGHWVAMWSRGESPNTVVARSEDNGATWTDPAMVANYGSPGLPQVTTDGVGHWMAVWDAYGEGSGDPLGGDRDLLVSRSVDNGVTWTAPVPLNSDAADPSKSGDVGPQVATDGLGHWVAVWESREIIEDDIDWDIAFARSVDNGATWTDPALFDPNAAFDTVYDGYPDVTTDGLGHWLAVWASRSDLGGVIGSDADILVARSVDNGATWTAPAPLNTTATTDSGDDWEPEVTTDRLGRWMAVWCSRDELGGTLGTDYDVLVARSVDNGATWTDPQPLNTNAATDSWEDVYPQVRTNGLGHWLAMWWSDDVLGGASGSDYDILFARYTGDWDGDGLLDDVETGTGVYIDETHTGTDPNDPDTDNDGLSDGDEVYIYGTDPNDRDTDDDTVFDGIEISLGTDPLDPNDTPDVPAATTTGLLLLSGLFLVTGIVLVRRRTVCGQGNTREEK